MDPNANIAEQLRLAERILNPDASDDEVVSDALDLAELVHSLDDWICKGGALPEAWGRK